MLARYSRNKHGKLVKTADIYSAQEHGIRSALIDRDAKNICERLRNAGYEAYVVGGAVRDLALHLAPKDFDIVTDAHPGAIRRLFSNARIIGRRFKLVHIAVGRKLFEVATFRALRADEEGVVYGKLDEDAFRRDFTMNALYYDPHDEKVIDFHGGMKHINERVIRPVVPLATTFKEDPVRIIRAIKYASITNSVLPADLRKAIKRDARLLADCSHSRLSEELIKIFAGGASAQFFREAYALKALEYWVPALALYMKRLSKRAGADLFLRLEAFDAKEKPKAEEGLNALLSDYLAAAVTGSEDPFDDGVKALKTMLRPVVLPNVVIEAATRIILQEHGVSWKKRTTEDESGETPLRRRPRRRSGRPRASP